VYHAPIIWGAIMAKPYKEAHDLLLAGMGLGGSADGPYLGAEGDGRVRLAR